MIIKSTTCLIAFFLFFTSSITAQNTFSNSYYFPTGNVPPTYSVATAFSPDQDGQFIGFSTNLDTGIYVSRADTLGQLLYSKLYYNPLITGFFQIRLNSLHVFSDSLLTIVGDKFLLKTNKSGDIISCRQLVTLNFSPYITQIKELNGFLYGVGTINTSTSPAGLVVKMKMSGVVVEAHVFQSVSAARHVNFNCIEKTQDGGLILVGEHAIGTHRKLLMVKTDSSFTVQWQRHHMYSTGLTYAVPVEVVQTPDAGFLMLVNNSANTSSRFIKADSSGNITSARIYRTSVSAEPYLFNLSPLPSGNYIAGGNHSIQPVSYEVDANGDLISCRTYPLPSSAEYFYARGSVYTPGKGISVSGYSITTPGSVRKVKWILTDSFLTAPCANNTISPTMIPLTMTDSVFNFTMVPSAVVTNDITAQISDSLLVLNSSACQTTALEETAADNPVSVYPNPSHNGLHVAFPHPLVEAVVALFDQTGKEVEKRVVESGVETQLNFDVSPGVYSLFIYSKEARPQMVKVVKM
jgi:hypothetical protein